MLWIILGPKVTKSIFQIANNIRKEVIEPMFKNMDDLRNFIFEQSKTIVGESGLIGSAVVVFEFIDEQGNAGYSLLRPTGTDWNDSLTLLFRAAEVIKQSYEDGTGVRSNDEDDEDDEFNPDYF